MKNKRIIFDNGTGGVSVIIPVGDCGLTIEEIAAKDAPKGAKIVDVSEIPSDRTFRNAWVMSGKTISEHPAKALEIAHDVRRQARAAEFAPLDLKVTIPGETKQAELDRAKVRVKYAKVQTDMDAAPDVDTLRGIVKGLSVPGEAKS